jgi:hypothetical protein
MVGEMHGTKASYTFITDLLQEISKNESFQYLLLEHDIVSAIEINKYIQSGNQKFLNNFFKDLQGTFAYNLSYYSFFESLYWINKKKEKKLTVIGIDIQQPIGKGFTYIQSLIDDYKIDIQYQLPILAEVLKKWKSKTPIQDLITFVPKLWEECKSMPIHYDKPFRKQQEEIKYIIRNIHFSLYCSINKNYNEARDSCMFLNFDYFNQKYQLNQLLTLGFFGRSHAHKSANTNYNTLTARITKHEPSLNIQTICLFYNTASCKFILPKKYFTDLKDLKFKEYGVGNFFQDEKDFTGIHRLQTAAENRKITVFNLTQNKSPYFMSKDLIFKIHPQKNTLDYIDFAVFIQSSDEVIPLELN